jgi:DNA replication protein DnaC
MTPTFDSGDLTPPTLEFCPVCDYKLGPGPCQHCHEVEQGRKAEEFRRKSVDVTRLGGLKAYEQFTLAKYTNKLAIELCSGFPDINLFIWGAAGTGKTHLATAIARTHPTTQVVKPQHIYRECRGIKNGSEEQAAINKYIHLPVMVIDDLGVDKKTDFSLSTLYEIVEGRDMAMKNGLIITSNLSLDSLAERLGDDRITSRIIGMCKVVHLTGADHRMQSRETK